MNADAAPQGRAAVVTGASSGIGEACALRLDQSGFRVFAGVRRDADGAALRSRASDRLTPILLDVTDADSIAAAARDVAEAVGSAGLAGLINNAGILVAGPLEFLPVAEIRRQLEVNAVGQIAVTQAFLPLLRQGRGRIVNMGSIGGRLAMPFIGPYNASKFAMEAFTAALRIELRAWNIPVSIIEPAFIATPLWERSLIRADDTLMTLPPEAARLYGPLINVTREAYMNVGKLGIPVEAVAKAAVYALTTARPKTRYVVGTRTRLQTVLLASLPDRVRDFLITYWLRKTAKRSPASRP